jgi:hypothetical protein
MYIIYFIYLRCKITEQLWILLGFLQFSQIHPKSHYNFAAVITKKGHNMHKFFDKPSQSLKLVFGIVLGITFPWHAHAQRSLTYFLQQARQNSPLIIASQNAKLQREEERQRLKALYTHARWELGGDLQFVPIITTDGGKTRFKADAQSADSYAGYDP